METIPQKILISDIVIQNRIRKDLGDINGLANSIKENGLIEPIVLAHDWKEEPSASGYNTVSSIFVKLVAGERRLTALKSLGLTEIEHTHDGQGHYVWRSELESNDPQKKLLALAIEMEENIRRKDLSWQEQVLGKAKLLEIMQKIHGLPISGRPSEATSASQQPGFGIRKLAVLLGESATQTSDDLNLAALMSKIPALKLEPTREDARRKFTSEAIKALITMKSTSATVDESFATLYFGSVFSNIQNIQNESVDLVYTDLPYGVDLDKMDKHQGAELNYEDSREAIAGSLECIAREAYRILKPDKFAVFWFGFNYYGELLSALDLYGFNTNPVPFIWYKRTGSTQLPLILYANSYEQALVARKGNPRFLKPGQRNVLELGPEISKLHIAQQPVALPKKFIEDCTLPGATVVDLMCGSGTTGVAAIESGRKCILFEQDKTTYDYAKLRIEDTIRRVRK